MMHGYSLEWFDREALWSKLKWEPKTRGGSINMRKLLLGFAILVNIVLASPREEVCRIVIKILDSCAEDGKKGISCSYLRKAVAVLLFERGLPAKEARSTGEMCQKVCEDPISYYVSRTILYDECLRN